MKKKTNKNKIVMCIRISEDSLINSNINSQKLDKINEYYFKNIHDVITRYQGILDIAQQLDQIVYWDCSSNCAITNALDAALEIQERNIKIQKIVEKDCTFKIEIGIAMGEVILIENMLIGDVVNESMAYAKLCKIFHTNNIIDRDLYFLGSNEYFFREIDNINIKNIKGIEIFELLGSKT